MTDDRWIGRHVGTRTAGHDVPRPPFGTVLRIESSPDGTPIAVLKTGPNPHETAHVCVTELLETRHD